MAGIMNRETTKLVVVKNCGVNCCNSKHNLKFINGKAIIQTWEMFEIEKCWKKIVREKCDIVCPEKRQCEEHMWLNVFSFFSEYVKERNTYRNDIFSKISIRENCGYKGCFNEWYFEIYETKYLTEPGTRAKYL